MVQMKVLWMMMMTEEETKINNVSVPNLGKSSSSVDVERIISDTPDDHINKEQPNNDSPREQPNNDYPPREQPNNDYPPREQTKQHLSLGQSITKSRNPMITLVCLSGAYPERYSDVRRIVEVAVHNPLIARVVLVLNDASSDINVLKSALEYEKNMVHWTEDLNVVVDVLKAERNSLNNRYDRSLLNITSEAVMILDDDYVITQDTIYCLYESWVQKKAGIHSFGRGRAVYPDKGEEGYREENFATPSEDVNFLLPSMLFLSSYMDTYFEPRYAEIRDYVDIHEAHCDDIAFASIITQSTGIPLTYVPAPNSFRKRFTGGLHWLNKRFKEQLDGNYGLIPQLKSLSTNGVNRNLQRCECSKRISSILNNWTMPVIERFGSCSYHDTFRILDENHISDHLKGLLDKIPFHSVLVHVENSTSSSSDDSASTFVRWTRHAVDHICPLSSKSFRPEAIVVPGMFELKDNGSSHGGTFLGNKDSNVGNAFLETGLVGPLVTSHTKDELIKAFNAIRLHYKHIKHNQKSVLDRENSEFESWNRIQIRGSRDVLMSRCYAFEPICENLVKDPLIVNAVKDVIGDDIVATSIDIFSKSQDQIQPWHTDIEQYDRCYNKNVQIWLAVDQVGPNSTLQIMSHSHRMPSITWLYPDHVASTKTITDKRAFEREYLLNCAAEFDSDARIVSPVTKDGEFVLFHSQIWHAAEVNVPFRSAIRITYSTPDCQAGHYPKYMRPDIPPMKPASSLPLVMMVSGSVNSLPGNNFLPNNFVHMGALGTVRMDEAELQRRHKHLSTKKTTTEVQIWNEHDIKNLAKVFALPDGTIRKKSNILVGNTPLLSSIELTEVSLDPYKTAHNLYDIHEEGAIMIVTKGQIGLHTLPLEPSEGILAHEKVQRYTRQVPEVTILEKNSIIFIPPNSYHNDVSGANGGAFFHIKFKVRQDDTSGSANNKTTSALVPQNPYFFIKPPLDQTAVNGQTFFEKDNFAGLQKIRGFTCRCVHNSHVDNDHEVIMVVDYIPHDVELIFSTDGQNIAKGAILYYPLDTVHGIEARNKTNGEIIPYRKQNKVFSDFPRCLVIEFWSRH